MEGMVQRVCVDSNILIALLRKDEATKNLIQQTDADFCISSITSFELWRGRRNAEPVEELLSWLPVLPLDDESSRLAGDMFRDLQDKGALIDLRDLFIAATCITNHLPLLTYNKKHFERLKKYGLTLATLQ